MSKEISGLKDLYLHGTLYTNTISEYTSGSGLTLDSVLLKDGALQLSEVSAPTNVANKTYIYHSSADDALHFKINSDTSYLNIANNGVVTTTGSITCDQLFTNKGTVTQATSITTGVSLNAVSGVITTVSATTAGASASDFVLTDGFIQTTSVVLITLLDYSGTIVTNGIPVVCVDNIAAGSCTIRIVNVHASNALSGVLKIGFNIF